MRTSTTRAITLLCLALPGLAGKAHDHSHATSNDLEFHQNKGQWPQQVLYRARTHGGAVFVEGDAFTYVIRSGGEYLMHGRADGVAEPLRMHAYKVRFEGARAQRQEGIDRMPHYVNYFLGNDPAQWGTGAAVFGGVKLFDLYPGIHMQVHGHEGMKYDWLVDVGADPSRIIMHYEGQDAMHVEGGLLFVETSAGRVVEQRPEAEDLEVVLRQR